MILRRSLILSALALAACGGGTKRPRDFGSPDLHPNETPELRRKINYWSDHYQVPRSLVHRVIIRESSHRPHARNGPYYGLMQILPETARTMGHRGSPNQLLDADTNLQYAVKYLRGAYIVANGNHDRAVSWYARGYYYEAKRRGLLEQTGLRG
ncbi:lytic transglycosylase domain-containing protein [uncultured Paracoccus sp.]|uniref:lytic transglycosylase domain-containing protein n=1 Tax=uncultured Paracoccus sp. TaxID=189685 RepID=UPI0025DE905C|nr:lytic transglycosylase domain-containing protein [uncultured Paracoccus sp.]